jgi:hypothetical protein
MLGLMTKLLILLAAFMAAPPSPAPYSEGQVWQYKTRAQDAGSLVKIQKIEKTGRETIYHVSIIGIHVDGETAIPLPHTPVTRGTLDASVTKQVADPGTFPDPAGGIEEWRSARGGVFTISLAQIADAMDAAIPPPQPVSD